MQVLWWCLEWRTKKVANISLETTKLASLHSCRKVVCLERILNVSLER